MRRQIVSSVHCEGHKKASDLDVGTGGVCKGVCLDDGASGSTLLSSRVAVGGVGADVREQKGGSQKGRVASERED